MRNWKWGTISAVAVLTAVVLLSDATPVRGAKSASVTKAVFKTPKPVDPIAARVPILVVGDSLQVGTGPNLVEKLGERIRVFARRGRPSSEGLEVLRRKLRDRHRVVVFDLGSNDDPAEPSILEQNMREARRLAGRKRCFVIATVNPVPLREPLNQVIRKIAKRPNVRVLDWQKRIARHPELLEEGDRVHSTPHGYKVRARALIRTIRTCPPVLRDV